MVNVSTEAKQPTDVLALDWEESGLYAVRLKKHHDAIEVAAADRLPLPTPAETGSGKAKNNSKLALPKALNARTVAVAIAGEESVVRLVHFREAQKPSAQLEKRLMENLGVDSSFRLSYVTTSSGAKKNNLALAVALPESVAADHLRYVGSMRGLKSLEVSGLASLNSFLFGPGSDLEKPVAVVVGGEKVTLLGVFNRDRMILVRKFALGRHHMVQRVASSMGLEPDIAGQMLSDASFDVSALLDEVMSSFVNQLNISREFVERHESCTLDSLYLSGSLGLFPFWGTYLGSKLGLQVASWDPFEGLDRADEAVPPALRAMAPAFSGAVGAGLGALGAV